MAAGGGGAPRHGGDRPPAVCGGHDLARNFGVSVRVTGWGDASGEEEDSGGCVRPRVVLRHGRKLFPRRRACWLGSRLTRTSTGAPTPKLPPWTGASQSSPSTTTAYRDTGPGLNIDIISVNTGILHHLLTGESASSRERFQRLVDRWASTGNPRLALLWIPLTDLSLLASLTNLQYVNLSHTLVTDLSPLAGLTNLRSLVLMSTPVTDLSPLAGLTNLRFLT